VKLLVTIPTLSRADLLLRNKKFLETIEPPDAVLILDNGNQKIDIRVPVERPGRNLGVPASWNLFLRRAFIDHDFDGLVLLQDDIIWDPIKLEMARELLASKPDVDLFLSYHQFSVQVHRALNLWRIGLYDERFSPALCEDDDYALTMTKVGRIYERFRSLDPLPGSLMDQTPKSTPWAAQNAKLKAKWGGNVRGINDPGNPWYVTNRGAIS
jgi:hypothetical protein